MINGLIQQATRSIYPAASSKERFFGAEGLEAALIINNSQPVIALMTDLSAQLFHVSVGSAVPGIGIYIDQIQTRFPGDHTKLAQIFDHGVDCAKMSTANITSPTTHNATKSEPYALRGERLSHCGTLSWGNLYYVIGGEKSQTVSTVDGNPINVREGTMALFGSFRYEGILSDAQMNHVSHLIAVITDAGTTVDARGAVIAWRNGGNVPLAFSRKLGGNIVRCHDKGVDGEEITLENLIAEMNSVNVQQRESGPSAHTTYIGFTVYPYQITK